jgi:hypothetical protein
MGDEPIRMDVMAAALSQIEREKIAGAKPLEETGEAGVARIAAAENNTRRGKERGDQSKALDIGGHFVDNAQSRTAKDL